MKKINKSQKKKAKKKLHEKKCQQIKSKNTITERF